MADRFSLSERHSLQDAVARFKHMLELRLPEFDWRIAISRRRDIGERGREESTELLRMATEERDLYRWRDRWRFKWQAADIVWRNA